MSAEEILKDVGLARIAGRLCAEKSLETTADLEKLSDEDIDRLDWLTPQQNKKMKFLCEASRRGNPGLLEDVWRERRPASGQGIEYLLAMLKDA